MVKFANKLKSVKKYLQTWDKQTFGKVDQKVRHAKDSVLQIEFAFDTDPSESNKIKLCQAKQELDGMHQIEEKYWRQKANIKWVK